MSDSKKPKNQPPTSPPSNKQPPRQPISNVQKFSRSHSDDATKAYVPKDKGPNQDKKSS